MRFDDPEDVGPRQTGGIQFFGGVDWLFDKTGHYYLPDDMPGSPGVNERTRERQVQRADYWNNVRTAEDLLIIPFGYVLFRIVRACLRSCFGRRHRYQQLQGPTFWNRAKLSLLGPTTVHLRYECALLLCNALLTSAALVSIYRGGFGSWDDLRYVALSVLVMSRHVALRWLCLNDTSTSSHPTVMGTMAKILSKFCAAGQVFDSPPSSVLMTSDQHEVGGYGKGRAGRTILIRAWCRRLMTTFGIPNYGNRSGDTSTGTSNTTGNGKSSGSGTQHARKKSGGASSGGGGGGGRQTINFSSDRESAKDDPSPLSDPIAYIRSYAPELAHKLATFREKYVPPTQKCVWLGTLLLAAVGLRYFYQSESGDVPVEGYPGAGDMFHSNGLSSQTNPQNPLGNNPKQAVQHDSAASEYGGFGSLFGLGTPGARHRSGGPEGHDPPSFVAIVFHLSWMITVASLLIFGRVFFPAPDLAVSTSAQKAIRADMRHHGGGGGGGGGKHGSKSKHHSESIPWAEQYYSINADNRFRLHCRVIFLRIIENVLLCVVVPHTEFACIAAGHCSPNPYVWDLPGYLGVASSRNRVGGFPGSMYEDVVFDKFVSVVLALTIVVITGAILMSQVVALDRSCLASMGYLNEELIKRPEKGSSRSGGRNRDRRTGVADIDPFRDTNFLKNIYSRLMWRIFRYEVGHQSKSRVTAFACVALLGCFGMNILVLLAHFVAEKDLAASVLIAYASYKATGIMAIDGTMDTKKMRSLAAEMQST